MSWSMKGSYAETCSCELMCPCNLSFDHGATYDYCRVTLVFNIEDGDIEGTDVNGRTLALIADTPKVIPLFDSVRKIPEIVDGIRCQCGCANPPEFYSLLSCYEGDAMARHCVLCQGQGQLVVRLHKEGKTLDQIRAAVEAKFG